MHAKLAHAHMVLNRENTGPTRRAEALEVIEAWANGIGAVLPNAQQFIDMPLKEKLSGIEILSHLVDDVSLGTLAKVLRTSIERYENHFEAA